MVFSRYSNRVTACNFEQKNPLFIVMNVNTVLCLLWLSSALLNKTWCSEVVLMRAIVLYCEIRGSRSGVADVSAVLGYYSMSTG